jgi:hypothetical protein
MTGAIITLVTSSVLFTAFAFLVKMEERSARRLIGVRFRAALDRGVVRIGSETRRRWRHVMRYVVQLGWYYSLHSLLRGILKVLVSVYAFIEHMFERNRLRTKELRQELKRHKSHLGHIADHKAETTLSFEQQTTLKKKKLEDNH